MMVFDFSFYLFLGTLITGFIWAFDVWVLAPRRSKVYHAQTEIHEGVEIKKGGKEPVIVEYSKSFFPVLLLVLIGGCAADPVDFNKPALRGDMITGVRGTDRADALWHPGRAGGA